MVLFIGLSCQCCKLLEQCVHVHAGVVAIYAQVLLFLLKPVLGVALPICLQVDVDVHIFGLFPRKGLVSFLPTVKDMVLDFGLVVEGESDDELPEQLIAGLRLCKWDFFSAGPFKQS